MVVALGPGKFYGSSLPRPRIYTDVKFNSERVDPPLPVTDPLICWAQDAHWSMGGLSFLRRRLQGRIEGNINRLRSDRERAFKKAESQKEEPSPSPPPAPLPLKRKRRLIDEEEEAPKRTTVRKLKEEFDMVATTEEEEQKEVKRGGLIGRRLIKGLKGVTRTSPRRGVS